MKLNKKGFTLIEFLISIVIFFILVTMTFASYSYYQNISRVNIGAKEFSQILNSTKNLAIGGLVGLNSTFDLTNKSLGVYIQKGENEIKTYFYDHNTSFNLINLDSDKLYSTFELQKNINIGEIKINSSNYDNVMIFYESITGNVKIYKINNDGSKIEINENEIDFLINFREYTNGPLTKNLKYYKLTNVVDF